MNGREFADGEVVPGTRFRVVRLVGVGGMGSVYEVEHVELGKRFVLKSLLRELAARGDLVQRMRNEWRALAKLDHPNIVSVTDAGITSTGVPYYVMERLEGDTLAARLRAGRLPVGEALRTVSAVLHGLSAAHDIGVVHRDIKPPNVFLTLGGTVKLLDFGIAKIVHDEARSITARGVAIGTPRYMSPEQARGERVDGRADLYAVGLLIFESVSGAGPFDDAGDPNDVLLAHLSTEAPRLSSRVAGISARLDSLVASLLAKDPRARPCTARSVADDLDGIIRSRDSFEVLPPPVEDPTVPARPALLRPGEAGDKRRGATVADAPRSLAAADTVAGSGRPPPSGARREDTTIDEGAATALSGRAARSAAYDDRTLRLDELSGASPPALPGEPGETHTALPAVATTPGTPPPVEPRSSVLGELSEPPSRTRSRPGAVAAVSVLVAGLAAALVWVVVPRLCSRAGPGPAACNAPAATPSEPAPPEPASHPTASQKRPEPTLTAGGAAAGRPQAPVSSRRGRGASQATPPAVSAAAGALSPAVASAASRSRGRSPAPRRPVRPSRPPPSRQPLAERPMPASGL